MKMLSKRNGDQLLVYYEKISKDERLDLEHLNLFTSIYYWWAQNKFQNPLAITSKMLMDMSRLKTLSAYHKCIRDLHEYGYIKYIPSLHPDLGNMVYIVDQKNTDSEITSNKTISQ
jgi:hypothetical protein